MATRPGWAGRLGRGAVGGTAHAGRADAGRLTGGVGERAGYGPHPIPVAAGGAGQSAAGSIGRARRGNAWTWAVVARAGRRGGAVPVFTDLDILSEPAR